VWTGEQAADGRPGGVPLPGVRVLVADDDGPVRLLYLTLLREVPGVSSLVAASDGDDAVRVARRLPCQIAILDFNMPRLDGVDTAVLLRLHCPWTRVALHSADPRGLEEHAAGLGLPLFDKLDEWRLLEWVEEQADAWRRGEAAA
jgi:CheY-like chemotaxis protein